MTGPRQSNDSEQGAAVVDVVVAFQTCSSTAVVLLLLDTSVAECG